VRALAGQLRELRVPVQYSTLYLTSRFDGGFPKDEPLNQLVPLVEFQFDTPLGQYTAATANPGFAYVAVVSAEAIVPLTMRAGTVRVFARNSCSSWTTSCHQYLGSRS
jgi:hypothetical protein